MRIKRFIATYRILRMIKKMKDVRGTFEVRHGIKRLKFVANARQAAPIIRGFIISVEKEIS